MFGSNRLHKLTLGGCLALAILVHPARLNAQDDSKEIAPPIEEGQGVAPQSPAPQNDAGGEAASSQEPALQSLPFGTVKREGQAERACDARCQAAEQREVEDLAAQQSVAESTDEMVSISWGQIIVGGLGLVLLGYTLKLNRDATRAAVKAAESADAAVKGASDTAERQLRAYITVVPGQIVLQKLPTDRFEMRPVFGNTGQTPAYSLSYVGKACLIPFPVPENFDFSVPVSPAPSMSVIGPTQTNIMYCPVERFFTPQEIAAMKDQGPMRLGCYGTITYRDAFNKPRFTNFCMVALWDREGNPAWIYSQYHNDSD